VSRRKGLAVAAIDCGTNSTRLLIVDAKGTVLQRTAVVTRLGQGVDATGELANDAIERTVGVLKTFRHRMDEAKVGVVRLVATSAVRDAKNGQTFLTRASSIVGVEAELLSGVEEGRLTFAGATVNRSVGQEGTVVIDIGGGSTEIVAFRAEHVEVVSMKIGTVRLAERYFLHDPPLCSEVEALVSEVVGEIERNLIPAVPQSAPESAGLLVGVAGTVTALAALARNLKEYKNGSVDGYYLNYKYVGELCGQLLAEPSEKRVRRSQVLEGRADVIPVGALILREVMARLQFPRCLVSENDLLDGLVTTLLSDPSTPRESQAQ
jgi:exopolyphosphatase / guanosine-5'-triphosphate,3'-diphosphate pyrophosphatase